MDVFLGLDGRRESLSNHPTYCDLGCRYGRVQCSGSIANAYGCSIANAYDCSVANAYGSSTAYAFVGSAA